MSIVPHETHDERSWVALMAPSVELAKAVANTDFVRSALRGNPAAITAAILYGDEVGLGPFQSLANIAVIDGRPSLAAETQRALILAAGHDIWFEEMTSTKVTWAGRRRGSDQTQRVTWTLDDARRAGLAGRPNWRNYPRAMLSARASAELARAAFADVIGGLAATEELEGSDAPAAAPAEPETKQPTKLRRRRQTAAPVVPVTSAPEEPPQPPLPNENDDPAPKASDAQMRKLMAMFGERGMRDRDDRLDWTNKHLDRTVVSASELTEAEASKLIDALENAPRQAPPDETDPASPPGLPSGSVPTPARPEAASAHGASGPAAPAEAQLDLQNSSERPASPSQVDMLWWLRSEANVSDDWIGARLLGLGIQDPPKRVTRDTIKQLTQAQARELADALNSHIDQRRGEEK